MTDLSLALVQLERAEEAVSGPDLAREFRSRLERDPRLLHREGGPRHLTASAIVIDAPGEHVALVWHRKGQFWVQPGGHLEPQETSFETAARREVAEEIGLTRLERVGRGPAMLHAHELDAAFGHCQEHWDVQYLLRAPLPADALALRLSEESEAVRWVPWPRRDAGPEHDGSALPEGIVADLPGTLDALSPFWAEHTD